MTGETPCHPEAAPSRSSGQSGGSPVLSKASGFLPEFIPMEIGAGIEVTIRFVNVRGILSGRGGDVYETLSHSARRGQARSRRSGALTDSERRRGDQKNLRRCKNGRHSSFKNLSQRKIEFSPLSRRERGEGFFVWRRDTAK